MPVERMNWSDDDNSFDKETLFVLGGLAFVMLGSGMLLSVPSVRRYLHQIGLRNIAVTAFPGLERFLRSRSM